MEEAAIRAVLDPFKVEFDQFKKSHPVTPHLSHLPTPKEAKDSFRPLPGN
jgi:hypothetical protein